MHPIQKIVQMQKQGAAQGIYAACTANEYVIETCMERALKDGRDVLIEATANQVNQFGGYTGMMPFDFSEFVYGIAQKTDFPVDRIILGGDHLGPLTWRNEPSDAAMEQSQELIRQYVTAGFTKIHIDTSMHLGDDDHTVLLNTEIIARRGALLCKAAEEAYRERRRFFPKASYPVYVIGSEVPTPGGSQETEDTLHVTKTEDFRYTVEAFRDAFYRNGLEDAWERVVAVVVQPGVEFGDDTIHEYSREAARPLCDALRDYPRLVFEGHSTDYQNSEALKQMVEDGIAILKVGPALTFALREALFALCHIETELLSDRHEYRLSNFIEALEKAMLLKPMNWAAHYHGDPCRLKLARKYSMSDRARYYLPLPEVRAPIEHLVRNLRTAGIPLTLISQFMPIQYAKIRKGALKNDPEALLKDRIVNCIDDYLYAVSP